MTDKKSEVYAFIDSQNLNLGIQNHGWKLDWLKFRRFLEDNYGVTKAFMFIGYVPEFEEMYEKLHENGYAVVLKQTYDMTRPRKPEPDLSGLDGAQGNGGHRKEAYGKYEEREAQPVTQRSAKSTSGVISSVDEQAGAPRKNLIKGNIDADLVLWVMKEMKNYDKAIIVSGDGDFYGLVEYLHEQNKLLKILTPSWKYSNLFNRFEKYIDRIDQHRKELAYRTYKKPQNKN